MSNKDLVIELKAHIKDLMHEKEELNKSLSLKDSRIKQLLLKIEDANDEVKATVKKMSKCQEETSEALEEVEKMKKKIKTIRHNLGQEIDKDLIDENDAENPEETDQEQTTTIA
jgi:predicted  nucleic acid-binding Zn-ribbon protein